MKVVIEIHIWGGEYQLKHRPNFGECSKRPQILDSGRVGMILKGVFDQKTFHYLWFAVDGLKVEVSDFPIVILYIKCIENQPKSMVFEVELNFETTYSEPQVMKSFLVKNTF